MEIYATIHATIEDFRLYLQYEPLAMLGFFPILFIFFMLITFLARRKRRQITTAYEPDKLPNLQYKLWGVRVYFTFMGCLLLLMFGLFFYNAIMGV